MQSNIILVHMQSMQLLYLLHGHLFRLCSCELLLCGRAFSFSWD